MLFATFQVSEMLATLVTMSFKQVVRIESSNLTSVVRNIKGLVAYLDERKLTYLDWSGFHISDEWAKTFEETQAQGRLDM